MITYQIYPRSFSDSDGDGIGDLNGITRRLEYIKSLGVDAVWISPFFKSPMHDFGYDVSDYRAIDPSFGTMQDFHRLLAQCRSLGLKVLLDLVVSHTSDQHPWFAQSIERKEGKDDWYLWADPKPDGSPPNNWLSVFGGSAWQWDATRRQYYFHSFLASQPDLNLHTPAVQDQILEEIRFWLEQGVSGFRLDACNHYFQDLQLRDNPPRDDTSAAFQPYGYQVHLYDQGRPEALPFLARIRSLLDEYEAFSLAEVGGTDAIALMGDYTAPGRLHSAYSFSLMGSDGSAAHVAKVLERLRATIAPPALPCYAFSNHDKPRVATRWLNGREPVPTAKQLLALLLSMPGHICLYQGEELGLPQADVPFERLQDPYGKAFWPRFKGRDGCRTPMPWNSAEHAGFSTSEPWLPIPESHLSLAVEEQEKRLDSTLNTARHLIRLRRQNPGLAEGGVSSLENVGDRVSFLRTAGGQSIWCVYNLGRKECHVRHAQPGNVLAGQHAHWTGHSLTLDPSGFCWILR
ncbi:alpha-glucosidase [Opitutaceae bacterium EW11]|nr:alpha-glucosidase [Opitutaceae bacterium EW11]